MTDEQTPIRPPDYEYAASVPVPAPYAVAPYAYGPAQPAPVPTNPLAVASLICSLAGIVVAFFAPLAGIILGHIALSQIKRTGQPGRGLALAGVIVGYSLVGLAILFTVGYLILFAAILASVGVASSSGVF